MNMGADARRLRGDLQGDGAGRSSSPAREAQWNGAHRHDRRRLLAEQMVWAATDPPAATRRSTSSNGDVFRWRWLWPQLAAHFGVDADRVQGFDRRPGRWNSRWRASRASWRDIAAKHGLVEPDLARLASWWHTDADLGRDDGGRHRHEQEPGGRVHGVPSHGAGFRGAVREVSARAPDLLRRGSAATRAGVTPPGVSCQYLARAPVRS